MWVSASPGRRTSLSKYLYQRGKFLSMYQAGGPLVSRHRLLNKYGGTKYKKAPHPVSGVKRQIKLWISNERLACDTGNAGVPSCLFGHIRIEWLHAGRIERVLNASIIFGLVISSTLDHFAATLEHRARLDY